MKGGGGFGSSYFLIVIYKLIDLHRKLQCQWNGCPDGGPRMGS